MHSLIWGQALEPASFIWMRIEGNRGDRLLSFELFNKNYDLIAIFHK